MESSSLNHFDIIEQEEMDYVFINRDGIRYHATFYPVSDFYPQHPNTYSFSIEPEDRKAHPIDSKIATTIVEILRRFFSHNQNAMIMVCDSLDGKERKRRKLFDRWYDHFADDNILKYDASAPLDEYQLYLSIYFTRTNPNKEQLLRAFRDLLSTNLYELGI